MGDKRRRTCGGCGKNDSEVGPISWGGFCGTCGVAALEDNVIQMHTRRGPNFDKWRASMAACVGGVLLDAAARTGNTTSR